MKLRVSVQYHQGKEHSKEQSSRTSYNLYKIHINLIIFKFLALLTQFGMTSCFLNLIAVFKILHYNIMKL